MAGDWIKMRIDLQSHPKVVRILSAICPQDNGRLSDNFRVIGGLHAVWSIFDTHSEDGKLHGYTPNLMDEMIGWPGFSQAMIDVDWLKYDGKETLQMPDFTDHNGKSGKRRAEDQKRKRNVRKKSAKSPQSVRKESAICPKKNGLEKRREDNNNPIVPLPDWLDKNAWQDFVDHRKEIRKKLTPKAAEKNLAVLSEFQDRQREIIDTSIANGWQGLFPPKGPKPKPQVGNDLAGAI